jgi:coatomer subunit epsilon
VKAYALYRSGKDVEGLKEAEKLATSSGENGTVQVLAGTVLQAAGKSEEALVLLSKHQGNLEA